MKAINNFDKIQENGSFEKLPVGGYIIKILAVDDVPEKEYLKIFFDISDGEKKGFFQKAFKEDTRAEKKWPNAGSFIRSYKEKALPMFKGFTNAIENSNKGYKWNFDEKSLVNKIVGVVIGEEQYLNQKGQVRTRTYVSAVRSVDTIKKGEFTVPELKKLDATKVSSSQPKQDDFVDPFAAQSNEDVSNPFDNAATPTEDSTPWDDNNPFC